jgi:hypothetical protein
MAQRSPTADGAGANSGRGAAVPLAPLALSFACVGANGVATIAADTVFLSRFSLGELSRLIAVAATLRVVLAFAYSSWSARLERRGAGRTAEVGALLGTAGALLAGASVLHLDEPAVDWAVSLVALTVPSLLPLVAFNATTEGLDARHAKRLLPLVAAAATGGAIVLGAVAGPLARVGGPAALAATGALLAVFATWLLGRMSAGRAAAPPASAEAVDVSAPLSALLRVPAVRVVLGFATCGSVVTAFAEFAFKAAMKDAYSGADLASKLGLFTLVSNAVVLALQIFGTSRLVARLGVGRAIVVGPFVLAATTSMAFLLGPVAGTSLVRLGELSVRYGLGNSLLDVLLVPLRREVRSRAKVLVKGLASPAGAIFAGVVLALFGDAGPPPFAQLGFVLGTSALLFVVVRGAPRAYAEALAGSLAKDRRALEVSPEAALVFRASVRQELERLVGVGRDADAEVLLELMTERFFQIEDVSPAFRSSDRTLREAAVLAALRLAGPAGGARLLAVVPADRDPSIEELVLRVARERGGEPTPERLGRGLALAGSSTPAEAALWAECELATCLAASRAARAGDTSAKQRVDQHTKNLRKAVRDGAAATKAAALSALGRLGDRRAERDVFTALATPDRVVFREAARAAILLDSPGTVGLLVARLATGPFAGEATRALALAGPRAVGELILALPVSQGEGAVAPTAVAEGRTMSGTIRAARALARIGGPAARAVLPRFLEVGHRARVALARSFGSTSFDLATGEQREQICAAIRTLREYGAALVEQRRASRHARVVAEIDRRLRDSVQAVFDLVTPLAGRRTTGDARARLKDPSRRANVLELLETVLPSPLGAEVAAFVSLSVDVAGPPGGPRGVEVALEGTDARRPGPPLSGWLEKVSRHCENALPSSDPMGSILDRVVLLKGVGLFSELSGEELYPVAEIASLERRAAGEVVVEQGAPSDALYVVVRGTLDVLKDGAPVALLAAPQTFGELGVLDAEPRAATVRAKTEVELLRVPREELEILLDESPELSRAIIRTLLGYVRSGGKPRVAPKPTSGPGGA